MNEGFRLDSSDDDKLNDEIVDFLGLCGPFCLEWRIENLGHWTRDVHGDSLTATVDFRGRRVDYKVYPQSADGRLEAHFPEVLDRYRGQLTIKSGRNGRVLSAVRKEFDQRVLFGPEFELFRQNLHERLFFFFVVENVSAFLEREHATTVLECVPPDSAIAGSLDAGDVGLGNSGSPANPQRPDRLCSSRARERTARAEVAVRSDEDLQKRLDKATEELKRLTQEIVRMAELPSARRRRSGLQRPTVILRRRFPYCPPQRNPTPEQLVPSLRSLSISQGVQQLPLNDRLLVPSLRSLSISQGVEPLPLNDRLLVPSLRGLSISRGVQQLPSSSDRLEERTPLSPALNLGRMLAKGSQFK